ncbi:hypothetical protein EG68_12053 [Paragonimus skrjabini miyazakii]|uniref:SCP domain-containing protein n=1 Tax=Paragonimus skrjabini miyazakii TaxID=59628 RepID=A0A8S9YI19_9TREM|nr:hypothetical protein EG68_12053 [Paragonimus skrjabini miyazakii]
MIVKQWILVTLLSIQYLSCRATTSTADKTELLTLHNDLRQALLVCDYSDQEQPSSLPDLTWDTNLETKAQTLADQCQCDSQSIADRSVTSYDYVGQNVAAADNVTGAFQIWLNEQMGYTLGAYTCASTAGHYTQLVWADTTHVGCAVADCASLSNLQLVVCNYGPAGNRAGRAPYVSLGGCSVGTTAATTTDTAAVTTTETDTTIEDTTTADTATTTAAITTTAAATTTAAPTTTAAATTTAAPTTTAAATTTAAPTTTAATTTPSVG